MKDFTEILQRKLPADPEKGLYAPPKMPSTKVGKALMKFSGIATPKEVLGMVEYGNLLSGGTQVFTGSMVYYPGGKFKLEDLQAVHQNGTNLECHVNLNGVSTLVVLKTDHEAAAAALMNALDAVVYAPKAEDLAEALRDYAAEGFDPAQVNWLKLRDEVLRTIDRLHERFQDGKLSLDEYETKRLELLSRL